MLHQSGVQLQSQGAAHWRRITKQPLRSAARPLRNKAAFVIAYHRSLRAGQLGHSQLHPQPHPGCHDRPSILKLRSSIQQPRPVPPFRRLLGTVNPRPTHRPRRSPPPSQRMIRPPRCTLPRRRPNSDDCWRRQSEKLRQNALGGRPRSSRRDSGPNLMQRSRRLKPQLLNLKCKSNSNSHEYRHSRPPLQFQPALSPLERKNHGGKPFHLAVRRQNCLANRRSPRRNTTSMACWLAYSPL